jgi:cytochrome c oxidase subunit 2
MWFTVNAPGTHEVLCAEYCGANHSTMRAELFALDDADFARWLHQGDTSTESAAPYREIPQVATQLGPSRPMSLVRLGQEVAAQQGCLRCHTLDGSPHIGPTWAGLYGAKIALEGGGEAVADDAYLTESMMDPLARRHAGFQTVMPSYLGRLRPAEVAALLALIKSLRDVRGQDVRELSLPPPDVTAPAGAIGLPPQPSLPLVQPKPRAPDEPLPAAQGLPPPGAQPWPPMRGRVDVGPDGVGGDEKRGGETPGNERRGDEQR